jgi:allantoate deiminase
VEEIARETPQLVATVGKIDVTPGASNVIPGRARLTLDVRHPDDTVRTAAVMHLKSRAFDIAANRTLRMEWQIKQESPATPCDPALSERLAEAIAVSIPRVERLPSGAGHDAVAMSTLTPVAMLFVRCAGGISHHPAEAVTPSDVAVAIDVIDRFIDTLAQERCA